MSETQFVVYRKEETPYNKIISATWDIALTENCDVKLDLLDDSREMRMYRANNADAQETLIKEIHKENYIGKDLSIIGQRYGWRSAAEIYRYPVFLFKNDRPISGRERKRLRARVKRLSRELKTPIIISVNGHSSLHYSPADKKKVVDRNHVIYMLGGIMLIKYAPKEAARLKANPRRLVDKFHRNGILRCRELGAILWRIQREIHDFRPLSRIIRYIAFLTERQPKREHLIDMIFDALKMHSVLYGKNTYRKRKWFKEFLKCNAKTILKYRKYNKLVGNPDIMQRRLGKVHEKFYQFLKRELKAANMV